MIFLFILFVIIIIIIIKLIKALIKRWRTPKEKRLTFKQMVQTKIAAIKNCNRKKIKILLLGRYFTDGIIFKVIVYALLISIGFVYLYPMLYMLSYSFKSQADIVNPMVSWIPTSLSFANYARAAHVLDYGKTFAFSLLVTLVPAVFQTVVTSLIGYGFAKFNFKFKKLWLVLVLISFIIPSQVYTIPKYVLFYRLQLLETPWSIILPAILGQGVNSAIFILVFYQFFRMVPKSLDEAAEMDGAGPYKIFFKVGIPLAIPAFITCFLFGFVWYWNETYMSSLFLGGSGGKYQTLQIKLAYFVSEYSSLYGDSQELMQINEGIRLAATLLIIVPMLIVYFSMQRWFVEGVERTGITGE